MAKQYHIREYPTSAWAYISCAVLVSFGFFAVIHDLHIESLRYNPLLLFILFFVAPLAFFLLLGTLFTKHGRRASASLAVEVLLLSFGSHLIWANVWLYVFRENRYALAVAFMFFTSFGIILQCLLPIGLAYRWTKSERIGVSSIRRYVVEFLLLLAWTFLFCFAGMPAI